LFSWSIFLSFSAKITDWLAELLSTNMLRHLFFAGTNQRRRHRVG
jgi:hypothetical protein